MVLALDALWFGVLILLLVIFCLAYLMSARVWFALMLLVIVVGLALTAVSIITKRRREAAESAIVETEMLKYLKTRGIKGNLSELAEALNITQEDALWFLTSLEEQGAIPTGSTKALAPPPPEVATAKTEKMAADIKEKAAATQISPSEIESKQTICPQCGKPAGKGKFCNKCGAPVSLVQCSKCGAKSPADTQFCGECGTKLV
jgi:predicted RNA-binding Zn-ribbon protein involved in translation (DUF1610 family)